MRNRIGIRKLVDYFLSREDFPDFLDVFAPTYVYYCFCLAPDLGLRFLSELFRRHAVFLTKQLVEMCTVSEAKLVGNIRDRLIGGTEQPRRLLHGKEVAVL